MNPNKNVLLQIRIGHIQVTSSGSGLDMNPDLVTVRTYEKREKSDGSEKPDRKSRSRLTIYGRLAFFYFYHLKARECCGETYNFFVSMLKATSEKEKDPDPQVSGTDSRIRVRTKISRFHSTD